jgi:hypothetical protein
MLNRSSLSFGDNSPTQITTSVVARDPATPQTWDGELSSVAPLQDPVALERSRDEIANALTAILLHAEAIRLRSKRVAPQASNIASSATQIRSHAERVWRVLEDAKRYGVSLAVP